MKILPPSEEEREEHEHKQLMETRDELISCYDPLNECGEVAGMLADAQLGITSQASYQAACGTLCAQKSHSDGSTTFELTSPGGTCLIEITKPDGTSTINRIPPDLSREDVQTPVDPTFNALSPLNLQYVTGMTPPTAQTFSAWPDGDPLALFAPPLLESPPNYHPTIFDVAIPIGSESTMPHSTPDDRPMSPRSASERRHSKQRVTSVHSHAQDDMYSHHALPSPARVVTPPTPASPVGHQASKQVPHSQPKRRRREPSVSSSDDGSYEPTPKKRKTRHWTAHDYYCLFSAAIDEEYPKAKSKTACLRKVCDRLKRRKDYKKTHHDQTVQNKLKAGLRYKRNQLKANDTEVDALNDALTSGNEKDRSALVTALERYESLWDEGDRESSMTKEARVAAQIKQETNRLGAEAIRQNSLMTLRSQNRPPSFHESHVGTPSDPVPSSSSVPLDGSSNQEGVQPTKRVRAQERRLNHLNKMVRAEQESRHAAQNQLGQFLQGMERDRIAQNHLTSQLLGAFLQQSQSHSFHTAPPAPNLLAGWPYGQPAEPAQGGSQLPHTPSQNTPSLSNGSFDFNFNPFNRNGQD